MALAYSQGEMTTNEIYNLLEEKGRKANSGAIYITLDRLIEQGFVSYRKGEPLPQRAGKRRNIYKITKEGRAALDAVQSEAAILKHAF